LAGLAQAAILVDESFESYTAGVSIVGQGADDATFTGPWSGSDSFGIIADVSANPLSANGVTGGNQALSLTNRSRADSPERFFDTAIDPTDADPIYIRYLYRATIPSTGAFFYDAGHNWDHTYIGFRKNPEISLSYNNSLEALTGPDQTIDLMVVARITGSTVDMWINPTSEADLPVVSRDAVGNFSTLQGIAFADSDDSSATKYFDAFVITESFSETVVPEPATMSLLGLGGLALIRRKRS
jgi:hypothetical protein